MKKIAVLFADGTEELEALTPVDLLRRAGAECKIVSVQNEYLTGSHAITVKSDMNIHDACADDFDAVVIPGGMPGAENISNNALALSFIKDMINKNKLIASICASPAVVLSRNGLLVDRNATCYPAPQFVDILGACYTGADVEKDGNYISANGPKSAFKFSLAICEYLGLKINF